MKRRALLSEILLVLLVASPSCDQESGENTPTPVAGNEDHETRGGEAEKEPSDLDRSVSELVGLTCEHGKKTYLCDECRYQVGFVRAPASLFGEGLFSTARVERRQVAVPVVLTGEVRFDERRVAHVSTQVDGIIKTVHVVLGDRVRKGQPLLEVESVAVGESQAAFLEAEAMLALARRNFERVSELHRENISSEKEFLEARRELEAAEIRARGARAKLDRLGSGQGESGRLVLRAPLDGTVLFLHAVPGEAARPDESLLTVGDNTSVWVWADLYERDIAAVRRGQAGRKLAAAVFVKAYPGEEFPGTLDLISPAMDESSRTVKVRVQVENHDGRLLAGMFATVKLLVPGGEEALAVPRAALLEDEGRSFVFIHYQDEYYLRRPVVSGRQWDSWVEIVKGLEPAQEVVVEGAFLMKSDVLRSKMGAGCAD